MEGKPKPPSYVWDSLWSKGTTARATLNVVDTLVFKQGQLNKWIFTSKNGRVVKKSDGNINMQTVKQHFMRLAVEVGGSNVIAAVDAGSSSAPTMLTKDCWGQFITEISSALELSQASGGGGFDARVSAGSTALSFCSIQAVRAHRPGAFRSTFELQKDQKSTKLVTHKLTSKSLLVDREGAGELSNTSSGGKWFLNRAAALNQQVDLCTKQLVQVIECNKRVKVCSLQVCYSRDEQGRFWLCDVLGVTIRKLSAISESCSTFSAAAQAQDASSNLASARGAPLGSARAPNASGRAPSNASPPRVPGIAGGLPVQHAGVACACAGDYCEYNAKEEARQLLERIDPQSHLWGTDLARDEETRFLQQQIDLQKRLQQEEEEKVLGVRTHKVSLRSVQQARRDAMEVADGTLQRWLLKRDARKKLKQAQGVGGSSGNAGEKSLCMVEPAVGVCVRVGESMMLRWAHTGDVEAVSLFLYCGLQMVLELTPEDHNIGEYMWTVQDPHPLLTKSSAAATANGGSGVLWRIRVSEFGAGASGSAVSDYSEPFEIDARAVSPRAGAASIARAAAGASKSRVGERSGGVGGLAHVAEAEEAEEAEPMQPHNPLRPHKMVMVCQRCHDCYAQLDERRENMQQQAYKQQQARVMEEQWRMELADAQAPLSTEPLRRIHAMRQSQHSQQGGNVGLDGTPRSMLSPRAKLRPPSEFGKDGQPRESGRDMSRRLMELSELTGSGSSATYEDYEDMTRQAQQREEDGEGVHPHEARPQSLGALREIKLNPLRSNGGKEYDLDTDRSRQSRRSSGGSSVRRPLPERTAAAIARLAQPSVTRLQQIEEDGAENWQMGRTLEGGANDKLRRLYRGGGDMSVRKKGAKAMPSVMRGGKKERWWEKTKGKEGKEGDEKEGRSTGKKKKGNTGAPKLQSAMRAEERRLGKKPTRWAPPDEVKEAKDQTRRMKLAKKGADEEADAERKWQRAQDWFDGEGNEDDDDEGDEGDEGGEDDEEDYPPAYDALFGEQGGNPQVDSAAGVTVNTERGQKLLEEVQTMMKHQQQKANGDAFATIDAEWANVGQAKREDSDEDDEEDEEEEEEEERSVAHEEEEESEEEEEEAMDWVARMKQRVNAMTSEVAPEGGAKGRGGGAAADPVVPALAGGAGGAGGGGSASRGIQVAEKADPRFQTEVKEREGVAQDVESERERFLRELNAAPAPAANAEPSWKQIMEQRQAEVEKHIKELPVLRQISCPADGIEGATGTLQSAMRKCQGLPDCAMTDAIAWGYYTFHAAKDALQPQVAQEGGRLMSAGDGTNRMLDYFNRYAETTGKDPLGAVFEAVDGQLASLKQEAAKGPAGVDQTTIKIYSRLLELLHFTESQMKLRGLPTVGK
jgi:hypothetical protein